MTLGNRSKRRSQGVPTYNFAKFPPNPNENENNWAGGGARVPAHSKFATALNVKFFFFFHTAWRILQAQRPPPQRRPRPSRRSNQRLCTTTTQPRLKSSCPVYLASS